MISAICLPDDLCNEKKMLIFSPQVWDELRPIKQSKVTIRFGSRVVEGVTLKKSSLPGPTMLSASRDLFYDLYLKEGIAYKLKMGNDASIEFGPTIGFLLGDSPYSYTPEYMNKFLDRFVIYTEIQGFICAFAEENIDWEQRVVHGLYYNPNGTTNETNWEYGVFPIPSVIYRRYFHNNEDNIARLQEITGYRLFNSSRFSKYEFYHILKKDPHLAIHLPHTMILSLEERFIRNFLKTHSEAILKPIDLSRGRGIFYIRLLKRKEVCIIDHRPEQPVEMVLRALDVLPYLKQEIPNPDKYIIQELIRMVRIDSSPFDIRVVMQKNEEAKWVCNGMEARHAVPGSYVTNLAKGGRATSVEDALNLAFRTNEETVKWQVRNIELISRRICTQIEKSYPKQLFAELGIDLGVDANGKLWIIEANVYPSFKGIKHFKMDQYMNIRYTPLRYANSISGFFK